MNSKTAKRLRKMAKIEMETDAGIVDRELVLARKRGHDVVINNPNSTRAMYLALKGAYNSMSRQ